MPPISLGEVSARLLVAVLCGAVIGLDRELHGKPAGLRTHALVALGAALVVAAAWRIGAGGHEADVASRVAQGVLTGIGFLGAGVILRDPDEGHVHGLTTAATIWLTSLIGVASGAGAFREVALGLVLTVLVLFLGGPFEELVRRLFHRPPAGG
jgi:putative Mg2+ transporter-C (MgtC) family protein